MSYAAQQASGVACWMRDRDHIEKAFDFGGMGARNGVTAALLVASGCTGVDDVFSGERSFHYAHGDKPDREALGRELGTRFEILGTGIKRWTVGSPIRAPLDALDVLDVLVRRHGVGAAQFKALHVRIPHESLSIVDNREMPEICLQHLVAVMLVDGRMDFHAAHDRQRMDDLAVRAARAHHAVRRRRALKCKTRPWACLRLCWASPRRWPCARPCGRWSRRQRLQNWGGCCSPRAEGVRRRFPCAATGLPCNFRFAGSARPSRASAGFRTGPGSASLAPWPPA
jgi:hypothetical protein